MDFSKDDLGRQKFADLLGGYATRLASASISPAGRVIAVDAPWGTGKSWIAKRLPEHFLHDVRIGNCVYVDAFQFDYHSDPFAVVTSAILDGLQEHAAEASNLRKAATEVIKASLPAIAKGVIKVGGRVIGFDTDDLISAVVEAGSDASEKAIAKMLESFTQTKATSEAFQKKLSELAIANPNKAPLVVVIDELDRCRPSYALELLERVKHLFDVQNVVFIFFVHTPALHSAIRKTYGQDIDPSEYLKKFFSLTVGLPVADRPQYNQSNQTDFIGKFIESQFGATDLKSESEFRSALAIFAPIFTASFRDIESAMLLWKIVPEGNLFDWPMAAYLLLLKVKDQSQFLAVGSRNPSAYIVESGRLDSAQNRDTNLINFMQAMFLYGSDPDSYLEKNSKSPRLHRWTPSSDDAKRGLQDLQNLISNLQLEYIRF